MDDKEGIISVYKKEETAKTFDRERKEFAYQRYKHKIEANILKRALNPNKNLKILDVGCGTGRFLPVVFSKNSKNAYFGLDTSKAMLKHLKKKALDLGFSKKIKLIIADATKIPFKDNTFDVAFTYHLLWHLPLKDQKIIISEMLRATKPGGIIIFDILNKQFLWEKIKGPFSIKKLEEIHKTDIKEVKQIISNRPFVLEKLSDAPIKNTFLYNCFNILNEVRGLLPNFFFHMLYFTVKK